jgi:hypothetical protein
MNSRPIVRVQRERRNPARIAGTPWQPPYVADSTWYTQEEGTVTESIQGNQVCITVRLRRAYAVMLDAGSTGEFRETFARLRSIWRCVDFLSKVGLFVAVAYLMWSFVSSFLPGGAAYQVLDGLQ